MSLNGRKQVVELMPANDNVSRLVYFHRGRRKQRRWIRIEDSLVRHGQFDAEVDKITDLSGAVLWQRPTVAGQA